MKKDKQKSRDIRRKMMYFLTVFGLYIGIYLCGMTLYAYLHVFFQFSPIVTLVVMLLHLFITNFLTHKLLGTEMVKRRFRQI